MGRLQSVNLPKIILSWVAQFKTFQASWCLGLSMICLEASTLAHEQLRFDFGLLCLVFTGLYTPKEWQWPLYWSPGFRV
jgi:hypothetical protein